MPIEVTPLGKTKDSRLEHPENACTPIVVSCEFSENTIDLMLEQREKAYSSIIVMLDGIVMLSRLEHPLNPFFPMVVTPSGIETFLRFMQPLKAASPISVTVSGMETDIMS